MFGLMSAMAETTKRTLAAPEITATRLGSLRVIDNMRARWARFGYPPSVTTMQRTCRVLAATSSAARYASHSSFRGVWSN